MKTLNLLNPTKSDFEYKIIKFPDGQVHLRVERPKGLLTEVKVVTKLRNADDIFLALQAADIFRTWGVPSVDLKVTYLLAARTDRVLAIEEPYSLRIVANMLNANIMWSRNFRTIDVFDPHSPITAELLSCRVTDHCLFAYQVLQNLPNDVTLLSPDLGAVAKVQVVAHARNLRYCTATKKRDKDGKLSDPEILDPEVVKGKPVLILDDICDGGRTFINLLPLLQQAGATDVYLAVSHGIFSQGLEPLSGFKQVFTTNSYTDLKSQENLTVIDLF